MILVFGKSGQVAQELSKFEDTILLDRTQIDLTNPILCGEAIIDFEPNAVINAAAFTAVDQAESQEDLAHRINGQAPGVMAKACAKLDIPLVHISTDYVFDGSGKAPWKVADRPNPKNAYGRSKLKGEEVIIASGCTHALLRTSWVVSAHGSNFVKTMLRLSEKSQTLTIVDDQVGGPTCANDIAKACMSIAKQLMVDPTKTGTYHFSGMPNVSWYQFANAIFEQAGRNTIVQPVRTSEYPTLAPRPLNSRLDCNLLKEVFNISRPYWRDGLEDIIKELGVYHDTA